MSWWNPWRRETRTADLWAATAHPVTVASIAGDDATDAEAVAAYAACVQAIASALASLPALVYRDAGPSRVEQPAHPLARLMRAGPGGLATWADMIESWVADALRHGNGLLVIDRDGDGALVGLRFAPWRAAALVALESGRVAYDVTWPLVNGGSRRERLSPADVLHLKDRSDDGLIGRSRLSRSRATLATAIAGNATALSTMNNALTPGLALEVPGTLTAEQRTTMREQLNARHAGARNAGRALVLDGGITAKALQISPEDAELLASRKFSVEEVYRLFQVPPPLVQDYSHNTFTNSETAGRWFAQFTLGPWARKIEAEFARALLGPGESLELDLSGFLRGDPQTRWAAHKIALDAGVLTVDEVRAVEGYGPLPGAGVA